MRRTLALAGAAVLTVGLGALAGPASADNGIAQQQSDAVINEVAADLDPNSTVHNFDGNFIELRTADGVTEDVSLDDYEMFACSATGPLTEVVSVAEFGASHIVPENGRFLIANPTYAAGSGPEPDITVSSLNLLEQTAGGVRLVDTTASESDEIEWGDSVNCDFPDAGVTPTDDESINRGSPWSRATPTPQNSLGETS